MSKQEQFEEERETEERVGCFTLLIRFTVTTAVCILVILIGAYFFVGTDGFRSFLMSRFETAWDKPFHVEDSRGLLRGRVRLDGVQYGGPLEVAPSVIQAEEVTVSGLPFLWSWTGGLRGISRLAARDWQLVFVQDEEGEWSPEPLLRVHEVLNNWLQLDLVEPPGEADFAALPLVRPPVFPNTVMELREGLVRWVDAEGAELARAEDVSIDLTPLPLPSREATHILVSVDRVVVQGRTTARRVRLELLRSEGVDTFLWTPR